MDLAQWREAVLSFPTAGMLTTKHGAKAMIAGGRRGSIIHLLSTAAHFGQGASVDRSRELLGKSHAGIALLRRIFWRELDAIRAGRPTKAWRRLEQSSELPRQVAEPAGT